MGFSARDRKGYLPDALRWVKRSTAPKCASSAAGIVRLAPYALSGLPLRSFGLTDVPLFLIGEFAEACRSDPPE